MLASLVPILRCPFCHGGPLEPAPVVAQSGDWIDDATLRCQVCGRTTEIRDRIWHAMGNASAARTVAQLSNVTPPTPQLYERLWRVRSLSLLSGRSFPNAEELAELVACLAPKPGAVFVDVACSEGLYARALATKGATVIAIDHSLRFLRRVQIRAGSLPIVSVRALAQNLPISSDALDGAAMGASLNEIGDQPRAVAEMARVTRPGGAVFSMSLTTATTRVGRLVQRAVSPLGITTPTVEETIALFESAGLDVRSRELDRIVFRVGAARRLQHT